MDNINLGDHVKAIIKTSSFEEGRVLVFEVTKITPLNGFRIIDGKKIYNTPVISGTPLDDNTKKCDCIKYHKEFRSDCHDCKGTGVVSIVGCNASYVTEILKKGKVKLGEVKNVYKNNYLAYYADVNKNEMSSKYFRSLICYVLRNLNINVLRNIDEEKAMRAYMKNPIGLREKSSNKIVVNKNKFRKWLLRNFYKFYEDKDLIHKAANKRNEEYERQYWESVEEEYKKEFENA